MSVSAAMSVGRFSLTSEGAIQVPDTTIKSNSVVFLTKVKASGMNAFVSNYNTGVGFEVTGTDVEDQEDFAYVHFVI